MATMPSSKTTTRASKRAAIGAPPDEEATPYQMRLTESERRWAQEMAAALGPWAGSSDIIRMALAERYQRFQAGKRSKA